MRSTKRFFLTLLAILSVLILFSLSGIVAYAHPGRTDANGGHYNHETGEYHYHDGAYAGKSSGSTSTINNYNNSVYESYDYDSDGQSDIDLGANSEAIKATATAKPTDTPNRSEIGSSSNSTLSFGKVLKALLWAILPAFAFGVFISFFLSFLFMFFERLVDVAIPLFWTITLISYVILVFLYLT